MYLSAYEKMRNTEILTPVLLKIGGQYMTVDRKERDGAWLYGRRHKAEMIFKA